MNTEKTLDQVMEQAERDFYAQDPCIEPPSYTVGQESKPKGTLVLSEEFIAEWNDAYASFKGAFDTPQMRRKMPDEYSEDARKRLYQFNEALQASVLLSK